jgi:hypothetical protein
MSKGFYNTINLSGKELNKATGKAISLQDEVLEYFKSHPNAKLTPPMVMTALGKPSVPLTSFRRAMTNLSKAGDLIKTDEKAIGAYGLSNYLWKLNKKSQDYVQLTLI